MFRVKICGVTRVEDAVHAARCGADAIGLNFYSRSPRSVSAESAAEIAGAVAGGPLLVGVFVNEPAERIREIAREIPLGAAQLHGDETPDFLAELPLDLPVIRALRIGAEGLRSAIGFTDEAADAGRSLAGLLVDAPPRLGEESVYGGTGRTVDWRMLEGERQRLGRTPLILAGGLRPENVAQAIEIVGPSGVDTASGVESSPGQKDPRLVERFVQAAAAALNRD